MTETNDYLYEIKDCFITKTELDYISEIIKCLPTGFYIQPQVNLASIINRTDNSPYRNELFRNVDACIFDMRYRPIAVVEINDSTHNTHNRKERDKKVRNICEEAGLPIITLWTSYGINHEYITKRIQKAIEESKNPTRIKHSTTKQPEQLSITEEQQINQTIKQEGIQHQTYSEKSQILSVLLSVFFGFIGVPFYYIKKTMIGLIFSIIFLLLFSLSMISEDLPELFHFSTQTLYIIYGLVSNIVTAILFATGKIKDNKGLIVKNHNTK